VVPPGPSDSESTANRRQTGHQGDDQARRGDRASTADRHQTDHYFATTPTARSRPGRVRLSLPDLPDPGPDLVLHTDAAVFSGRAVDPGTLFLLTDGARPPAGRRADGSPPTLVDVGCGYGPVAIALALRAPEAEVWAVDVNQRALELCRANAARLGVGDRVRTATPAEVPDDLVVDEIWSNPPIRIGKPALHTLLTGWLGRLAPTPDAAAHLVVARNLGADSLARWLADQGHAVTRRASRRGYRLLDVGR
jgi:16S rRNA G1207 methylase RsmC